MYQPQHWTKFDFKTIFVIPKTISILQAETKYFHFMPKYMVVKLLIWIWNMPETAIYPRRMVTRGTCNISQLQYRSSAYMIKMFVN